MKKTLFVVALATVLVFAFSGVAMAKITNGYVSWNDAVSNLDGTAATPHIGYTVNTEKCMVCHAVHNAAVSGTTWTGANPWTARSEDTEMLLRSNVANACVYCHITTNVGGVQLYNGNETLWTAPATVSAFSENVAHNRNSANCVNCHAVHGANTFQGAAASKILKVPTDTTKFQDEILGQTGLGAYLSDDGVTTGLYPTLADAIANTNPVDGVGGKSVQVSVFCTQCHQNYSYASEDVINSDGDYVYGDATYVDGDATANLQYKTHPMKSADAVFSAQGDTFGGQAAFVASNTCRSCHDAGETDEAAGLTSSNFPHYTAGAYSFVNVAANYEGYAAAAPGNTNHGSDGMCLKCHASSNGVSGVGVQF